jgi:hypothetical protein
VTLTPLDYNMTRKSALAQMQPWEFRLDGEQSEDDPEDDSGPRGPVMKTARKVKK